MHFNTHLFCTKVLIYVSFPILITCRLSPLLDHFIYQNICVIFMHLEWPRFEVNIVKRT